MLLKQLYFDNSFLSLIDNITLLSLTTNTMIYLLLFISISR